MQEDPTKSSEDRAGAGDATRSAVAPNRIDTIVERNIQAIAEMRRRADRRRSTEQRMVDGVARVVGSTRFVYAHLVFFAAWLVVNSGAIPGAPIFDPFPFVLLTTAVSLEAILLTSIILVNQNRMQRMDAERAELDLQIDLLAEHEVTRILRRVEALVRDRGIALDDGDIEALQQETTPSHILRAIEKDEAGVENDIDAGDSRTKRQ
jgi:uncharacterized membrane protein